MNSTSGLQRQKTRERTLFHSPNFNFQSVKDFSFCFLLALVLLLRYFVNSVYFLCSLVLLFLLLFVDSINSKRDLHSVFLVLIPILIIFIYGSSFSLLDGLNEFRSVARDIYYFGILFLYIGIGFLFSACVPFEKELKTIVATGAIISVINCCRYLFFSSRPAYYRPYFLAGLDYVSLGIVLIFYYLIQYKKWLFSLWGLFLIPDFVLAQTRTNYLLIGFFVVFASCFLVRNRKVVLSFGVAVVFCLVLVAALYFLDIGNAKWFIEHAFSSFSESSPYHDWTIQANRTSYWRGYELWCAFSDYFSSSVTNKLFGHGFGHSIPLPYAQPLDGKIFYSIPWSHNGFGTILCKFGITGFLLFGLTYFQIGKIAHYKLDNTEKTLAFTLIAYLIIASFFAAGLIYNLDFDTVFLLLISFLFKKSVLTSEYQFTIC